MVNAKAAALLQSTNSAINKLKNSPMNLWASITKFLRYVMLGRIGVTIFLLGWMIVISALVVWKQNNTSREYTYGGSTEEEKDQPIYNKFILNDDKNYNRYYNLHRIWFGEESIVMIVFKMWYYAVLMWMLSPLLREIVVFMKLKMMM